MPMMVTKTCNRREQMADRQPDPGEQKPDDIAQQAQETGTNIILP